MDSELKSGNIIISDMIVKGHYVNEAILRKNGKDYIVYSGCVFEYTLTPAYDSAKISSAPSNYLPSFYDENGLVVDYTDLTIYLKDGTTTRNLDTLVSDIKKVKVRYSRKVRRIVAPTKIVRVIRLSTKELTSMERMFYYCKDLFLVNAKGWDTRKVTSMKEMFYYCNSIYSLDLSSFDTTNVTNMDRMFAYCKKLTYLNLSTWDTSNVNSMTEMLGGTLPDLGIFGWEYNGINYDKWTLTEKETGYNGTFPWNMEFNLLYTIAETAISEETTIGEQIAVINKCIPRFVLRDSGKLTVNRDISVKDISRVEILYDYKSDVSFENLTWMESVEKFTPNPKHTSFYSLFKNCKALKNVNGISTWDTSNVVIMDYMFFNCFKLQADISSWNTSKVEYMNYVFSGCNLPQVNLANWDVSNVVSMKNMFNNFSGAIYGISDWNVSNVKAMNGMFARSSIGGDLDLSNWDVSNVTSFSYMFSGCRSPYNITLRNWDLRNAESSIIFMFEDSCFHSICITGDIDTFTISNLFDGCRYLEDVTIIFDNHSTLTEAYSLFRNCSSLESVDLSWLGVNGSIDMENTSYMFQNCSSLQHLNMSTWVISDSLTVNTYGMFEGVPEIKNANWCYDGLNYNAFKVTERKAHYAYTFPWNKQFVELTCYSVQAPENSSNLTRYDYIPRTTRNGDSSEIIDLDFVYQFDNHRNIITYSGPYDGDLTKERPVGYVRVFCEEGKYPDKLILEENKLITEMDYLRICENWTSLAGFFNNCSNLTSVDMTYNGTVNITNMQGMFDNCTSLMSVDLHFATTSVKSMAYMFQNCSSLQTLDISNLHVVNVNNMVHMFDGCTALTTLNVGFHPIMLRYTQYMFQNCSSLQTLDLSNWNVCLWDSTLMFKGCSSLTYLNLSNFDTHLQTDNESYYATGMLSGVPESVDWDYTGSNYTKWTLSESLTNFSGTFPWNIK